MHRALTPKPQPANGEVRERVRFALLPVRIGDALYWLEQYRELQAYVMPPPVQVEGGLMQGIGKWTTYAKKPVKWIAV